MSPFDCSVGASPNLCMPLAFSQSRSLSFCYHTLVKHPCRIRRPPTTVLLSYNAMASGFLFSSWHELANGMVKMSMNNELIAEYESRTRSSNMTSVLHHRWPSPIVDLCQKSKHTSVGQLFSFHLINSLLPPPRSFLTVQNEPAST